MDDSADVSGEQSNSNSDLLSDNAIRSRSPQNRVVDERVVGGTDHIPPHVTIRSASEKDETFFRIETDQELIQYAVLAEGVKAYKYSDADGSRQIRCVIIKKNGVLLRHEEFSGESCEIQIHWDGHACEPH